MMKNSSRTTGDGRIYRMLNQLDLDPVKVKLIKSENWSRHKVDEVEVQYKRYLWLVYKYPNKSIVPSKDVDTFWHNHILDTGKYAEDCERIFGYFVHHFPYFGMRGSSDERKLRRAAQETRNLYLAEFQDVARSTDSMSRVSETYELCGGHECSSSSRVKIGRDVRPRLRPPNH
jgi:hypothetical protein